jgi:FKBP-type peptidyl-prolyl cis-trans isomerase
MKRLGCLFFLVLVGCAGEPGIPTTTPSGLRYQDIEEGTGAAAQPKDFVQVNYTGVLRDGREFDSSKRAGQPFLFALGYGEVIKGWDEGVVGMKVGGKRKLWVPPQLGYGAQKTPSIPPNSQLIFEIELLKIIQLKSEDRAEGTGEPVRPGDAVEVHYTGTLKDGTVFDSSSKRGKPARCVVGTSRLPGLGKGLIGMKQGGKRRLTIPPELAYGSKGNPPVIPPNAELIFDVELVSVTRR